MTKLIVVLIIVAALYGGWEFFLYFERIKNEETAAQKQAAASVVDPSQLQGLPQQLQPALQAATQQGATGLKNFLKNYGHALQDPRKAWIELDYVVAISREDPTEAKRLFAAVKERTAPASPVWPRIKQLEKTYQ
jgi:hypothetical protein